ncbi:MAG: hypothetical protein F6K14_01720 [Symploca sp. SIO2C1]|nr:hypothetical protein [Symploca sp. SIO2C1]
MGLKQYSSSRIREVQIQFPIPNSQFPIPRLFVPHLNEKRYIIFQQSTTNPHD